MNWLKATVIIAGCVVPYGILIIIILRMFKKVQETLKHTRNNLNEYKQHFERFDEWDQRIDEHYQKIQVMLSEYRSNFPPNPNSKK
jgi:uncharacterized membrane-anchored protein YhcB (DUF1043 family)